MVFKIGSHNKSNKTHIMLVSTQHSKKRFGMKLVVGEPHSQSPTYPQRFGN